jgi:hypothetical protein
MDTPQTTYVLPQTVEEAQDQEATLGCTWYSSGLGGTNQRVT